MTRYARLLPADAAGRQYAVDPIDAASTAEIATRYVPVIATQFIAVPAETAVGSYRDTTTLAWTHPAAEPAAAPAVVYRTLMSPVRFKAQFPLAAQVKIQLARNYAPSDPANPDMSKATAKAVLDILFGTLADLNQAGSEIDVTDPSVIEGIDELVTLQFIDVDLAAKIKLGVPFTA